VSNPASSQAGSERADPAREAWALMFELVLTHRAHVAAALAEYELSPMQAHVLRLLEPGAPVAMRQLAGALSCDASNVTGIVDRLELRRLVERRSAAHDRRVKFLALTREGAALRRRILEQLQEAPPAIATLPPDEQRALREILRSALGR